MYKLCQKDISPKDEKIIYINMYKSMRVKNAKIES